VSAKIPELVADIFSVTKTELNIFPCVPKTCGRQSPASHIERRDQVFDRFLTPDHSSFDLIKKMRLDEGPFFNDLE